MSGASIAVGAPVLAAAVGIKAGLEGEVGAGVPGDDGAALVVKELRGNALWLLACVIADVEG